MNSRTKNEYDDAEKLNIGSCRNWRYQVVVHVQAGDSGRKRDEGQQGTPELLAPVLFKFHPQGDEGKDQDDDEEGAPTQWTGRCARR